MSTVAPTRWQAFPALLVLLGVLCVWSCALALRETLGPWQWGIWIGGALALAGLGWFYKRLSQTELHLAQERREVALRQQVVIEQEAAWEASRKVIEGQLVQQSKQIDAREQALSGKLTTFHEWMEFPQPLDLSSPLPGDAELTELARKDRLLNELLQAETQRVYDDILANKYVVQGEFQSRLVRDDTLALVRRVARIYQPSVEEPLLETSLAQILRAASRACLQILMLLDQLPINAKEYTFSSLYGYVRQGVKAYGVYKSTEPFWPYVNTAYYLGRFAMGANPLTLAAWWFLGAWGKEGATQLATQLLQRQALTMLSSFVRVVGYEVAGMYGGDFRHRDPNWLYGVELAELTHQFPLSRESLAHALKEVGALQLRHEYDRVYLYRCIAAHASPDPDRFRGALLLSAEEKMAIARRLERFLEAFVHGQTAERVTKWRGQVEARLNVKLNVSGRADERSVTEQTDDALRSLASFVIAVKEREPEELTQLLPQVKLYADLPESDRERVLEQLLSNPPFYFEQPSLDPASPLVTKYLQDLAALAARTAPHEAVIDDLLVDVAIYLRQDAKRMRQWLDKQAASYLAERLPADAPEKRFPAPVARAVLDLIAPDEELRFVYGNVSFDWPSGVEGPDYPKQQTWLVGLGQRLVVFSLAERPVLLWRGETALTAQRVRGYLASDIRLHGGEWLGDLRAAMPVVRVAGPLIASHDSYFKPLLAWSNLAMQML
ncbi:MAG TPA: hypothetical protein VL096_01755 [Pirellulaceae bacterium]|nr:hypothetical protein [Pirellulaceae bacterium]